MNNLNEIIKTIINNKEISMQQSPSFHNNNIKYDFKLYYHIYSMVDTRY